MQETIIELFAATGNEAQMNAGQWFLGFFKDAIGTPAILVGLFAMLGSILLRKKGTEIVLSFFKTCAGFLIISAGATVLVILLDEFQLVFQDLFGVQGLVPNNDGFAGALEKIAPSIFQLGSIIMVVSMILNIVLAFTSRFKYIFLSGHVLFFMSVMLAGVMVVGGKAIGFDIGKPGDYAVALISSSLFMSLYMVLSCAANKRFVKEITKSDDITLAHTGSLGYIMSGWIGELIYKVKKGKNIKKTEDIKFPKWLQFFRNTFASMAVTMIIVFLVVYIPEGIMYNLGIKTLENNANAQNLAQLFGPNNMNWLVRAILNGFIFAADVEIILYGVRMVIGELVPSFKGISDKLIKNAKAGVDCPIVFPYAPNAVLIGFLSSLLAGLLGLGITIGLSKVNGGNYLPIVIPGIVAHFFLGATSGVYGNVKGGILGCVIGSFLHGLIISFVPIIFVAGNWVPEDQGGLSWGDTDYLLGLIPGLLAKIPNKPAVLSLLILVPLVPFIYLMVDGLIKAKKEKQLNLSVQPSSNEPNKPLPQKESLPPSQKLAKKTKNLSAMKKSKVKTVPPLKVKKRKVS